MNRRGFLTTLFLGAGALPLLLKKPEAPAPEPGGYVPMSYRYQYFFRNSQTGQLMGPYPYPSLRFEDIKPVRPQDIPVVIQRRWVNREQLERMRAIDKPNFPLEGCQ